MKYWLIVMCLVVSACGQPPSDWRDRIKTDYENDRVERFYPIIEPKGSLFEMYSSTSASSER